MALSPLSFALAVSECRPGSMVLTLVESVPTPPPLRETLTTNDPDDLIRLSSAPMEGGRGMVEVRLSASAAGWRGLSVEGAALWTAGGCVHVRPARLAIDFWKEPHPGIPTHVGSREVDLSRYAGHRVTFDWIRG